MMTNCFFPCELVSSSARFWHNDHDGSKFNDFDFQKQYRGIVKSFFENCFMFKTSCVVGHLSKEVVRNAKMVLINDFISMFPAMYGTFVTLTKDVEGCKNNITEDGKLWIKMTKSAKVFWESSVCDEWKTSYPDLKFFLDSYPREKIEIELVVEVYEHEIPTDLLGIEGKKKYFLQANDLTIKKLVQSFQQARKKKPMKPD